jgi:hypothetical protein
MRVIVAHSLLSYRGIISTVLQALRPHLEIFSVDPQDLDAEFRRLSPQVVVCSRVTELVEREALAWIELYPDHASSESVVSLDGEKVTYPEIDLELLLSILDETQRLHETALK